MFCSESFSGLCFACVGLESCWRSGVSELCLQGTFANGFAWLVLFFMDSKGNVRRVFLACVFHARGTHPDAVRVFRKQFPKAMWRDHWRGISRAIELLFFMDSKGNVRRVFLACVFHARGTHPDAVRVFRKRSARNISWLQEFSCCLRHSVGNVRALFVAAVLKGWSRNLLLFESFASAPQGTFRGCKSFPAV